MSATWRRRLVIAGALYFTFLGGTFITDHRLWPRIAHHAVVTALLGGWLGVMLVRRRRFPRTPLDAPLLAYFAAYSLATTFALDPRISLEALWRLLTHTLLFYLLIDLIRIEPRDVLEAQFFSAAVVVLIGLVEFGGWYFGTFPALGFEQGWPEIGGLAHPIPPRLHRLNFTLGFSTGLSAYMAALIPFGLAFALTARQRDHRRAFWLWLVGVLIVEGMSFSRGGLLSLAVSLPTFALLMLRMEEVRASAKHILRDPKVWAGAAAILVAVGALGAGWLRQNLSGHMAGDAVRLDLWRSALAVGRADPLTGVGPYGFGRALRSVRDPSITGDRHLTADNRPLTTLAEAGLPGLAALLWLVGSAVWMGWGRARASQGGTYVRVAGTCAGLMGFAAHSLVDTFTATPILTPVWVMAAYLAAPLEPERVGSPRRSMVAVAGLALLVLSAIGWTVSDMAQAHFTRSLRLAEGGDLPSALAEIDIARRLDPALGLYDTQRAYFLGRIALEDETYLDKALSAYETALAHEDTYALNQANYAALLFLSGDGASAGDALERAAALDPNDPRYQLWLGLVIASQGNLYDGAFSEARALVHNPRWAAPGYWSASPERFALYTQAVPLAASVMPSHQAAILWLEAGDIDRALSKAEAGVRLSPDLVETHLALGEVALRAGEIETALRALDRVLELDDTLPYAYALRAETHLLDGDKAGAERDARTAIFLDSVQGRRGYYVLGQLAEARGDPETAARNYERAGPVYFLEQNWDVSVYGRRASLDYLLDAPGPTRYDLDPWLALARLYLDQGRAEDAEAVYEAIRAQDPSFEPPAN
jgi:tetratricopeptide (TPR) repeat protein/O-antigen ligase